MNRKQSWTFSMNARCPKCREEVSFKGAFDHNHTEIILDAVFGILGLTVGMPLLMMDAHDALRILGASLAILSTWSLTVMLVRWIHLKTYRKDSTRWPLPEQNDIPEAHQK